MDAVARPRSRFPIVQVVLFGATVVTTLLVGSLMSDAARALETARTTGQILAAVPAALLEGLRFSAALLGILLVHEMGHWVVARRHGVDASLPYFIPFPFGVGTLGAVIRMRSAMPTRAAAIDIGAAGPLAGFAIAIPILLWGLAHSEVTAATAGVSGESPALLAIVWRVAHGLAAAPPETDFIVFGESLLFRGAQWLALGSLPAGTDVHIHPVGFAAWVGLLVTSLNLVPVGQLDGGHVAYALVGGRRARAVGRVASALLLAAGLALSWSWLFWWALTRWLVGLGHPPALDERPLDGRRRALAWLCLAVLALTFVPVPVSF